MNLRSRISILVFLSLAFILSSCSSTFMVIDTPKEMPPPRVLTKKPRVAVVLGGGAFLGMAHVGVLKVFEENNIPIDLIVGTSAGSFIGAMYASYPNSDTVKQIGLRIKSTEIFNASLFNSMTGFVTGENLQQCLLDNVRAKNIEDTKIPFVAVTTDLISGKTVALSSGPLAPSVNSSCAIPMIFEPVKMYGMTFVDGGVLNGVPVDIARSYNPDVIIAIDLMSVLSTNPEVKNFIDVLGRAYQIAAYKVKQKIVLDADVLLEPKLDKFPLLSDKFDEQVYQAGYTVAKENIEKIKKVIEEKVVK